MKDIWDAYRKDADELNQDPFAWMDEGNRRYRVLGLLAVFLSCFVSLGILYWLYTLL